MKNDLRTLIEYLKANNQLINVEKEVDSAFEVTAVSQRIRDEYGSAVFFNNVKGSDIPLITYLFPDREAVAFSLSMQPETMLPSWSDREENHLPFKIVDTGRVKEVIDRSPDLRKLPLSTHCDGNAGPYITGGIVVARHPQTGTLNASWNRCQLVGRDKLRVRMMPPQHLGVYHAHAERLGRPLEVAIVIGAPPSLMFSAASKIPSGRDELEFAGALGTEALDVVKCETNDVFVPADAEIVIEGKVLPDVREEEGPFGEFTDSYVPVMKNHVFQATAVTHRKNPIYHDIYAGGKEDLLLLGVPIEAEVYNHIRKYANEIKGVATNPFVFGCVIGIKKEREDQPKSILLSALAAYSWIKMVVVVDDDVDIFSAEDVLWAIQNRCCPDKDILMVPGVSTYTREDVKELHVGKFGFDATAPLHMKEIIRRRTNFFDEKINLDDYIKT